MISGKGNENDEKNNRSDQQKNNFARAAHFFVHFFAVVLHDHNVKLPEISQLHFLWRKCRTICCSLFFTRSFSPGGCQDFSFSHWPVAHFIFSLYCKFEDMTINLSLILQTTRIQKQFSLSVFVFIDSLVDSASQDAGGYAISRQNNLEVRSRHLSRCICWLSYFTLVYLWCGRTVVRAYGHVITKISQMGRSPNFLTHGAPLRSRGAPL